MPHPYSVSVMVAPNSHKLGQAVLSEPSVSLDVRGFADASFGASEKRVQV